MSSQRARPPASGRSSLRWRLSSEEAEGALFSPEELVTRHLGVGEYRSLELYEVNARRILNRVPARSRMPFRWTLNAYRGCAHACVYCFARPTHAYLGLGIGEDFERRIVVKVNAVERLKAELEEPAWQGEAIAMGTNTDPYQKAEARYHLTRGIVELLVRHRNPFSILTKSTLILRDLDLLVAAARRTEVSLALSIGTLDREVWRLTEPGTPPPDQRVAALRRLRRAGLACSVLIAPILPGLSDGAEQVGEVARACAEAGATAVTAIPLHLRPGVREHFLSWLAQARPDLLETYEARFRGRPYQPAAEQERLRTVVRTAVDRTRASRGAPPAGVGRPTWRRVRRPLAEPAPARGPDGGAAPAPCGEQLQLF